MSSSSVIPYKHKNVAALSATGRTALDRGILESERRHCGNKSEEISGKPVIVSTREELATLLDPRTLAVSGCLVDGVWESTLNISESEHERLVAQLKRAYIKFYMVARKHTKEAAASKKKAATAAAAKTAPTPGMCVYG